MSAPPGWFQDPQRPPGHLRWWNGEAWTEQRVAPPDAPVPAAWSPIRWSRHHPRLAVAAAVVVLVAIVSAFNSASETRGADPARTIDEAGGVGHPEAEPERQAVDDEERTDEPPPKPAPPTRAPRPRTYLVTGIVDGDTLRLGNGETVRLVGIDTPERGECGAERAADNLTRLVLGKQVRLKESDEDRDKYGRLLRYVDIGSQDAGLRLLRNGLAVARYDSRDGYGRHPREDLYIAIDKGARQFTCAPKPQPLAQPPAGGDCEPGYTPCVPSYPPDVDCPDVDGPITVTGSDPHRLDADNDGVACE